jgi:aryl-alcohol dehydrogenase-like predicted oxidoreductase
MFESSSRCLQRLTSERASNYQNEESEKIVGEWMKLRGNRDQMVIATKYTSAWRLAHEEEEIQSIFGGNNKEALHVSVEASLRKLQTSYIDIVCKSHSCIP